jgi:hypothetical protein
MVAQSCLGADILFLWLTFAHDTLFSLADATTWEVPWKTTQSEAIHIGLLGGAAYDVRTVTGIFK